MAIVKALAKITAEAAKKALEMTAKDIAEMSADAFNKMTNAQLKGALRTMQKATSQRKRRLEKAGVFSEALQGFNERGGIKTDLKNRVAMQAELKRAINFMNAKTSTVRGATQANKQVRQAIGLDPSTPNSEVGDAWKMFHQLQEEYPNFLNNKAVGTLRYRNIQSAIGKASQRGATQEQISKTIRNMYEEAEKDNSGNVSRLIKSLREFDYEPWLKMNDREKWNSIFGGGDK